MESIFLEETPLAAYLEGNHFQIPRNCVSWNSTLTTTTGEGTADDSFNLMKENTQLPSPPASPKFAPRALSNPRLRPAKKFTQPLSLKIPEKSAIGKAHTAWSRAVNSRIGRAENAQFLEHFRYIIVASQLLNEYPDLGSLHTSKLQEQATTGPSGTSDLNNDTVNMNGVLITAGVAFAIALLVQWVRGRHVSKSRILLVLACSAVAGMVFYAHARRQWLKYVRNQAVDSASGLATNIRAFELTSVAALSLIQEVELVSKGYRLYVLLKHNITALYKTSANMIQKHTTAANLQIRGCQRQQKVCEVTQMPAAIVRYCPSCVQRGECGTCSSLEGRRSRKVSGRL